MNILSLKSNLFKLFDPLISRMTQQAYARRHHPIVLFIFVFFVGSVRGLSEAFLYDPATFDISIIFAYQPFYLMMHAAFSFSLFYFGHVTAERARNAALVGLFIGIFPPFLDLIFNAGVDTSTRYGYLTSLFIHDDFNFNLLFFYAPDQRMPVGECFSLWFSLFVLYRFLVLQKVGLLKRVLAVAACYFFILFIAYLEPSIIGYLVSKWQNTSWLLFGRMDYFIAISQLVISVMLFFGFVPALAKRLLARQVHILPFTAVALCGAMLVQADVVQILLTMLFVHAVFTVALVQNDFGDDELMPSGKLLVSKHTLTFFHCWIAYFIVLELVHKQLSALAMITIVLTGALYSLPFYRGKRSVYASMKFEGVWGVAAFVLGLFSNEVVFKKMIGLGSSFRPVIGYGILLVFGGFSLFSIWKDAKDLSRDVSKRQGNFFQLFHPSYVKRVYYLVYFSTAFLLAMPIIFAYYPYIVDQELLSKMGLVSQTRFIIFIFLLVSYLVQLFLMTRLQKAIYFRGFLIGMAGYLVLLGSFVVPHLHMLLKQP